MHPLGDIYMKNLILPALALLITPVALAQDPTESTEAVEDSTLAEKTPTLTLSGYVDTYYGWFSDEVGRNQLQQYTTVSPRSQQFGLNVAQIGTAYASEKLRGNFILSYGDIAIATWSKEFPFIQEANLGVKLANNLWLDAGFFATHIGTESFLPKNNMLSSTAVATYNEPFYQAGARLSYEGIKNLDAQLWVINGYNYFLDFNDAKSVGLYLSYAFNDNLSLTYTNLFGDEAPDEANFTQFRTYQNLYLNAQFNKLYLTLGGDYGTQSNTAFTPSEEEGEAAEMATMYNALATLRYQFSPQFSVTGRGEVFQDVWGFISGTLPTMGSRDEGLQLVGLTLGTEFRPVENAYLRLESRYLNASDQLQIFSDAGKLSDQRWEILATMGFTFDKVFNLKNN